MDTLNSDPSQVPTWVSLMPLLFISLVFALAVLWIAPRKGKSRLLALLVFVPCVGPLTLLYLVSLTDKKVLDDIAELKRKLTNPSS